MITFGPSRISAIQLVRRYPFQSGGNDIRFRQFDFEKAFKPWFPSSPSVTPNIEAAPPDAARFIFQHGKMTLMVAGTATQLTLILESSIDYNAIKKLLSKYSAAMDDGLNELLGDAIPSYSGIVGHIVRPYDGKDSDIARESAAIILNKKIENILALNMEFGYLNGEVVRSISINGYKTFTATGVAGEMIHIDPDFSEPSESGMQIKIDVNTKQTARVAGKNKFAALVPHFLEMLAGDAQTALDGLMPNIEK